MREPPQCQNVSPSFFAPRRVIQGNSPSSACDPPTINAALPPIKPQSPASSLNIYFVIYKNRDVILQMVYLVDLEVKGGNWMYQKDSEENRMGQLLFMSYSAAKNQEFWNQYLMEYNLGLIYLEPWDSHQQVRFSLR